MFQEFLGTVFQFLIECSQTLYIHLLDSPPNQEAGSDHHLSPKMDNGNIWFDGVDKKLIEAHSVKKALVVGSDQTLTTKTPLESLASFLKKRKLKKSEYHRQKLNLVAKDIKPKKTNGKDLTNRDSIRPSTEITDELAIDCEMVECYHHKSVLARVSIVNLFGHPIYDRYVAPPSKVTDYRTKYSGIRPRDLVRAPDFDSVRDEVCEIIKDRIVVGHSIHNDFSALKVSHPPEKTRDTQVYYRTLFQGKTPSLRKLSESLLGVKIQDGEHDSVQDAQATMKLYVRERVKWEETLLKNSDRVHKTKKHNKKTKPKKKKMKTFYVHT